MIKDLAIRFMLLFTLNVALGQVVPEELTIGDLTLQLTENARRQIQGDVDRLTASQTYYGILVDRMNLYFPIIADEFEKAGVPKEIMFLSIQESALISDAVSSANAVGFWQFKDFTAREMGLRVDRQVDERQNIRAASRGAAKYLNGNNFFFDNWAYAVLSYQAGVAGAQKHVNESDFGAKKMKITTRSYWYVKKFIAHLVAFAPTLGLAHSENLWLEELTDVQGKTLAQIARDKNIDIEEVKK
jgi:membrane-bound lytic murein transglycosylase D